MAKKDKIQESESQVGQTKYNLTTSMNNEFRMLINEMLALNAVLVRECETSELREYAVNIQNVGRNLLSLVNDVMDFSKVESGEMTIAPVTYDLFLTLNECYDLFSARAQDKNLQFNFKVDMNLPMELCGDEKRIRQIISNLLFYAVKYTKRGEVTFEATFDRVADGPRDSINLILVVKDSGEGIPKDAMDELFLISQRIERQQNVESVDLALNLTKLLVDLQGGNLQVDSDFGRGTTFKISIPQMIKKETIVGDFFSRRQKYASSVEYTVNKFYAPDVNVLIADEVPMNQRLIRGLLKGTEINVDEASNGMDALEKIKRKHYHLIFLDKEMPVMGAEETLDIIKTLSGNPNADTPVIMTLTEDDQFGLDRCKKLGFAECLHKPIRNEDLFPILTKLIPVSLLKMDKTESEKSRPDPIAVVDEKKNSEEEPAVDTATLIAMAQEAGVSSDLLRLSATGFIDVIVGMNFCQNDEGLYREQLADFVKLNRESSLETAFQNEDYELYRLEIRSLKSAALEIGAVDTASHAKALEFACKDGFYDYVQMNHGVFMHEYRNLMNVLSEMM